MVYLIILKIHCAGHPCEIINGVLRQQCYELKHIMLPLWTGWEQQRVGGVMCVFMCVFGCTELWGRRGRGWSWPTLHISTSRKDKSYRLVSSPTSIAGCRDGPISIMAFIYLSLCKWREMKHRDISGKRIICSGELDHLSHGTWWSGCKRLGEVEIPMNFICEVVSRTPSQPRLRNFLQTVFKFQTGMEKAERHYLIQCNYCGGFAHGRFAFIMFIQMFIYLFIYLGLWVQVALVLVVCARQCCFVWVYR